MKLQPYVKKLNNSPQYKDFVKKNSGAFMMAGFFVIDFEAGNNIHQIDFYVPKEKKVAAFTLDGQVTMQMLNLAVKSKVPEKLEMKNNIDLDELHGILEDEMKNRNITEEIKKMIAVLHKIDGKEIWNINCVLSGMEVLRANVEDASKTVLKMEKTSIMDLMKMVPQSAMMPKAGAKEGLSKKEAKKQLENLDKLEQAIEEEKKELEKEVAPEKSKKSSKKSAKESKADPEEEVDEEEKEKDKEEPEGPVPEIEEPDED